MMTVYKVTNITDMDEVIVHKFELVVLPLRAARQLAMAANGRLGELQWPPVWKLRRRTTLELSPRNG